MKTVKQVSDLTGISVRMLHHYDKIGLLKPSSITDSGYRLYGDESLDTLQQILFFKELDIPLKKISEIIAGPQYDKMQTLQKQRQLLCLKRDRLNELIDLIEKRLEGGSTMSFKEFDMSEYFEMLEAYQKEHETEITQHYGGAEEFNRNLEKMKLKELEIAKMAIKEFGSIKEYTDAMKNNLDRLPEIMEGYEAVKKNMGDDLSRINQLTEKLTSDLNESPSSPRVQDIVKEMDSIVKEQHKALKIEMGKNHWGLMADLYLTKPEYIKVNDKKYGKGASKFIGEALKFYSENR